MQTEAASLVRHLYDAGHAGNPQMCQWHCRCEYCQLDSGYLFRGQTDSSCSGEVITRILHHDPSHPYHHGEVFDILQEASVATDAEPGMRAGMHVHVGIGHLGQTQRADALWAFLRYEPLLTRIAQGRFATHRGNNALARASLDWLVSEWGAERGKVTSGMQYVESGDGDLEYEDARYQALEAHYEADRHSNLCINTRHGTWEFRLWNSTRAAWRMELFTRLSVAMVDPTVVRSLNRTDFPGRVCRSLADTFTNTIAGAGHDRCAELLERQVAYSWERAMTAPSTLTCF